MPVLDDYWSRRYDELLPNGLTPQETDEANAEIWQNCYPTLDMQRDSERPEPILIVKQK
jgi:hypothetical protein